MLLFIEEHTRIAPQIGGRAVVAIVIVGAVATVHGIDELFTGVLAAVAARFGSGRLAGLALLCCLIPVLAIAAVVGLPLLILALEVLAADRGAALGLAAARAGTGGGGNQGLIRHTIAYSRSRVVTHLLLDVETL